MIEAQMYPVFHNMSKQNLLVDIFSEYTKLFSASFPIGRLFVECVMLKRISGKKLNNASHPYPPVYLSVLSHIFLNMKTSPLAFDSSIFLLSLLY